MTTREMFRIGDVANLMGLSRDTLRYYEKRGLLNSRKGENGYRYYTRQDISRLLGILYQRKMDIALDDIERIWGKGESVSSLSQIMQDRLAEEEAAIRKHRQTIARLQLTKRDCDNIQNHLDKILLTEPPQSYVIVPHTDMNSAIPTWFEYTQKYAGMDMMYIYHEYTWKKNGAGLEISYRNTSLRLNADLVPYVDYDFTAEPHQVTPAATCLTTFRTSDRQAPSEADLLPMVRRAEELGLNASQSVYCTFLTQGLQEGRQTYYLQLYLPVF